MLLVLCEVKKTFDVCNLVVCKMWSYWFSHNRTLLALNSSNNLDKCWIKVIWKN